MFNIDNENLKVMFADGGPICHVCKKTDCYKLIYHGECIVKQTLADDQGFLCQDCHEFMTNTGKIFTHFVLLLLNIKIFFRRLHVRSKQ